MTKRKSPMHLSNQAQAYKKISPNPIFICQNKGGRRRKTPKVFDGSLLRRV